jgi:hypothetical protein
MKLQTDRFEDSTSAFEIVFILILVTKEAYKYGKLYTLTFDFLAAITLFGCCSL